MPPSEAEARARVLSRLLFVVPRLWLQDFTADGSAPRCVNKWARWLHLRERERERRRRGRVVREDMEEELCGGGSGRRRVFSSGG
jgi:hypothetical protein